MASNTRRLRLDKTTAATLIVSAALWLLLLGAMASPLGALMMPGDARWTWSTLAAVFAMWTVMMAAMMLPAASPMVATFASLNRQASTAGPAVWVFAGGYVAMWMAYATAATALHWWLHWGGLLSAKLAVGDYVITGGLLMLAGAYQFTPLKRLCLVKCRTPLGFLLTEWRPGVTGALVMGFRHGMWCIGCCWALMLLLYAFGVMSVPWIAALTLAVVAEKLAPRGEQLGRGIGLALLAAGAWQWWTAAATD